MAFIRGTELVELTRPRRRAGVLALAVLWLLVPAIGIAGWQDTPDDWLTGTAGGLGIALLTSLVACFGLGAPLARYLFAVALVCSISLLLWLAPTGSRDDLSLLYLVTLPLLVCFRDPWPILLAAAATVAHALLLGTLAADEGGTPTLAVAELAVLLAQAALLLPLTRAPRRADPPVEAAAAEAETDDAEIVAVAAVAEDQPPAADPGPLPVLTLADLLQRAAEDHHGAFPVVHRPQGNAGNSGTQSVVAAVDKLAASIDRINREVSRASAA